MSGLCCCLLAVAGVAYAAAPSDIPEPSSLLVDQAGALNETEREALLGRLKTIQDAERAQIGVLVSRGTDGTSLADYALRVAERWKLGRAGRDDGLLIVVIPSPAGARIEVGYGLEGAIPDALASRWIDELLPSIREQEIAKGLDRLLGQIEGVLPQGKAPAASEEVYLFPDNPEWRVPFVLVIFSPFALFPLFFGRRGSIASAFLLAAFLGGAAWTLWDSSTAGYAFAGAAFVLPLLWGLNWTDTERLSPGLRYAKAFGNLVAVALFFALITLFIGVGLSAAGEPVWAAAFVAGMFAMGLAIFLFPGKPAGYLSVVLRSAMHFTFIIVVAYVALLPFNLDPFRIALAVAAIVTAFAALGLYFDDRERRVTRAGAVRWSLWCYGAAALVALPFGLLALFLSIGGEDLQTQLTQAAAGGGSIAAILALAARYGLIAAVKVGLGGAFGGGGAGRSD